MRLLKELIEAGGTRLWIGGEWREASDGAAFDVLDPATGEPIASVSSGSTDDAARRGDRGGRGGRGMGGDTAARQGRDPAPRLRDDGR